MIRAILFTLLSLTFTLCMMVPSTHAAGLFHFQSETKSTDISAFTKWTGAIKRHPKHLSKLEAQCESRKTCKKARLGGHADGPQRPAPHRTN